MALPAAQPRRHAHTRQVTFTGYQRDDGLWDIEGVLRDTKPMPFEVPGEKSWLPNEPIHNLSIRLTVNARLVIQDIQVSMDDVPHDECPQAMPPMQKLIGAQLASGWRKAIEENLGKSQGCAHLRELLFNMATAAFQTVTGTFEVTNPEIPPPHLNRCVAWRLDTELVSRRYPMFFKPPSTDGS
ncbi:hypothetical protein B9Z36_13955 [Limnohabitans sp. Rim8]|uniref:DUF2889 domain-containing protein n=1 Tax=Limnohabitans sp. Rim8 TaxID=1100718 RepID=UPI000D33F785|nr:DUF2889 domain-containing protein [Limnohabitans sp. Rim8]PUE53609.1 hypothetical protein B9Z36_13955 [Limnohabitans sp. Rim8]